MAAVTDLSWEQLKTAAVAAGKPDSAIAVVGGKVVIDVGAINGDAVAVLGNAGVVKFCAKLLDICAKAQATANEGQPGGERLAAFASPSVGNSTGGFVPVSRAVATRHELSSATTILGTVA